MRVCVYGAGSIGGFIGARLGCPIAQSGATPHIDTLLGLARLHARVRGPYPPAGACA